MISKINAIMAALLVCVSPAAFAGENETLLKSIDRNLNPESYESYRKLVNIEPDGRKKEYIMFTLKKGIDKMVVLFISPASDKGRSTLRLGDNMWLYIPNVGKPVRVTSLQSVVGGVFNNADILALDYAAEYDVQSVERTGGNYLLNLKAKTRAVAYDRVRLLADRERKLPVRIDCLTEKGMLIKTLYFKNVKDFGGGIVRPSVIETDSPLYRGYRSVMIYAKMRGRSVRDEVFTLSFMPRVESLRK